MRNRISNLRSRLLRGLLVWLLLEVITAAQVKSSTGNLLVSWVRAGVRPVTVVAEGLARAGRDLARGFTDLWSLVGENSRLREELETERARNLVLQRGVQAARDAERLSLVYPELAASSRVAACASRNLNSGLMEITAGWLDGVHRDSAVLSGRGLVGRVIRASPHRAWVELITRPTAAVAVQLAGTDLNGLAVGAGAAAVAVRYLPRRAEVVRGVLLVTSGADGVYPAGIPVARVTTVHESPGPFLRVRAAPEARFATARIVLVVVDWPTSAPGGPKP